MGLPAARKGDIGSGHSCHFPPSPGIEGSPNIFINGRPAMRVGDHYEEHSCGKHGGKHQRALAHGSETVFFNGRPAGRVSDRISCGGSHAVGSPNVFIGDVKLTATRLPFQEKCPFAKDSE